MEELGCTVDELNLSIDCADDSLRRNCATFLQEQWRQNLGIENITVNSMQTKQVAANRQSGDYCMSLGGWSPDYNDAINFLDLWVTDGGNNDSEIAHEEYDNLIAQATAEADEEVRQQYLFDAEEILAAEMPVIPLYWQCRTTPYNKDKIVDGAIITANQTTFYYALWPSKARSFRKKQYSFDKSLPHTQARALRCPRFAVFQGSLARQSGREWGECSFPSARRAPCV